MRDLQVTQELTDQESLHRINDYQFARLNTAIPAEVVKYDRAAQTVDVKVHFTEYLETDEAIIKDQWQEIPGVPLVTPQANGGKTSITFPVKPGDLVQLVFNQRSLDEWWQTSGKQEVTPRDLRIHDPSDAVAFLGLGTSKTKLPSKAASDDNLIITVSDTQIIVKPDGTVSIVGSRLNIGSESAATALAKASDLDSYLIRIATFLDAVGAALGLIPAVYPLFTPAPTTASSKAYTND